tara:strand:+ start:52 stop:276 length:225 start_codon:yes stop_codon:yes gene_type:complete
MQKTYFHNRKHISEKKVQKKKIPLKYIDQKRIVDINKLLNRVKIDQKNENKKKIIFYCSVVLIIGFFMKLLIIS